ncbi:MAG: LysM peptidoglycan-binding domain-containing protein [Candidatus Omnitrophota bacterium]
MKAQDKLYYLLGLSLVFVLSGCVVRTYPLTKDRVDQDLSGNRGYLLGNVPDGETRERKAKRTTQVVEVEFHSPIKFEKMPKPKPAEYTEDKQVWGNRGFITESTTPEMMEPVSVSKVSAVSRGKTEKYTVQKGDTLQKISQKFYGTTKKWNNIFEANSDKLKGPNKIYPGQVINVPVESMKETKENLK